MYVQCERCQTEYDFDDALVSERGTTVKCTSCGHQFKVRRSGGAGAEDRWLVNTADGRTLVFTSLKELQRAIGSNLVGRSDILTRGAGPPRPLGAIAELEPFFGASGGHDPSLGTAPTMADGRVPSGPPPPVRAPSNRPPPPPVTHSPSGSGTLRPPPASLGVPPPPPPAPGKTTQLGLGQAASAASSRAFPAAPRPPSNPPPAPPMRTPLRPPPSDLSSPLPPPVRRSLPSGYDDMEAPASPQRRASSLMDDGPPPVRRRVGGWVVAVVMLFGVGLLATVFGRPYLERLTKPVQSAPPLDPRVGQYLKEGEGALDQGNLDQAKESFDKASVLAEKDPRVVLDLARLATARADVPWLRQRLLPADSDAMRANKVELDDLATRAKKAAEDAVAVSRDDVAAKRVKVDALRIAGDRDGARALAGSLGAATQADTAYVLGMLDLAEIEPPWAIVVERLRTASNAEGMAGRARAALVYALARTGDTSGARRELERLTAMTRPHPLATPLKAYVDQSGVQTDGGAATTAAVDAGKPAPSASAPAAAGGGGGGAGGGGGGPALPSGDPRALLQQAATAKAKHDNTRARAFYEAVLQKSPNDSEALSGLGDVSHADHDLGGAQAFYRRALGVNPTYLPALVGLGDTQWESNDRAGAIKTYKEIIDRIPEGAYPIRVKQRVEGGSAPSPAPTAPTTEGQ
jgi:predicted Zn finger-like uncharacterized protein